MWEWEWSVLFPFPISWRSKIQDQHTLVWRARHFKQAASESESENGVSLQISGCMCQVRYCWRTPRQTAHSSQPQRARVRVKFPCKYLIAFARCGADDCQQFRDNYQLFLSSCSIFKNKNPTFLENCQCLWASQVHWGISIFFFIFKNYPKIGFVFSGGVQYQRFASQWCSYIT